MPTKKESTGSRRKTMSKTNDNQGEHPISPSKPSLVNTENVEKDLTAADSQTPPSTQAKIDEVFKPAEKSNIDIESLMNTLDEKLNKVASQEYIEKQFKKMITQEMLTNKFDKLKSDLKQQIKEEVKTMHSAITELKVTVVKLETTTTELQNKVSDMEQKMEQLETGNARLKENNNQLADTLKERTHTIVTQSNEINNLEQYTRRNSIRIYGINDTNHRESIEETTEKVIKLLNNNLGLNTVTTGDIDIAHRLGKFQTDGNRPIICKFVSRRHKLQSVKNRRKLKGTHIVIREDLTIKNAKLLEKVSTVTNVKTAWSDEGKIFALLTDDRIVAVDTKTDLSKSLVQSQRQGAHRTVQRQ